MGSEPVLETRWLQVSRNRYHDGNREVDDYYVLERSNFVLVLAVDPAGNMLLVHQYRPATEGFYLALPAGYLRDDETPVQAAARELFEETGVEGTGWHDIGQLDPLPGYIRSRAYVVRCDVPSLDPGALVGAGDPGEANTVLVRHRDEIRRLIATNQLREMQLVAAFLLCDAAEAAGCRP